MISRIIDLINNEYKLSARKSKPDGKAKRQEQLQN